jgi:hypothetical protein
MKDYSEQLAHAHESLALEEQDRNEVDIASLSWLKVQFPYWKSIYLKKNQPQNYLRVTRIIPPIPDAINRESLWVVKFQIWIKGELFADYKIDSAAFDYFSKLPDWKESNYTNLDCSILKPSQS